MLTREQAKAFSNVGNFDVAVFGAGPGGIGAAIAAARSGLKTVLVEQYGFAGGVGTLCCCPIFYGFGHEGRQMTAGVSEEVVRDLDNENKVCFFTMDMPLFPDMKKIGNRPLNRMVISDTDSLRVEYNSILRRSGVECQFYSYLVDAIVEDRKIVGALIGRIEGAGVIWAKNFIDATGDALLVHYAGGETRTYSDEYNMHKSLFFDMANVGPYDLEYARKEYKRLWDEGKTPGNCTDFYMHTEERVPGVTLVSFGKGIGDSLTSRGMTELEYGLREQQVEIANFMKENMPGFKNAETVFTSIRVGVRSGRGIVGIETHNREQLSRDTLPKNRICLVTRSYGQHSNERKFTPNWRHEQGGVGALTTGMLISKSFDNVLACGRAISTEPMLVETFRMMNTCLTTGEAAGLIAAMSQLNGVKPAELEYAKLRKEMEKRNFILE